MFKVLCRSMLMLTLALMFTLPLAAQPDDPREFVLEAFDRLAELGYQFTHEVLISTTYIRADEQYDNYAILEEQGEVAPNGDYRVVISRAGGESMEEAESSPFFVVEQRQIGDDLYINLMLEGTPYEAQLGVAGGWWHYDDLIAQFEGIMQTAIENQLSYRLPLGLFLDADVMTDVTELEPEVMDGMAMRVFAIEMDALLVLLRQSPGASGNQLRQIFEVASLMAESELQLNYRLWIGADDGLIYRGISEGRTMIPYLSAGMENGPDFDLDTSASVEFNISKHGESVEISAPSARDLNR